MNHLFDLSDKKILLTGASGGLGQGIAEGLLKVGAEVALVGASNRCPALADTYKASGLRAHGLQCDLSNRRQLRHMFENAMELLGGQLHVLINAAGIQRRHKSEEFPIEDWDAVMETNLNATFALCQLAGQKMIKQGGGKIVNFASMLSFFGGYTVPAYAASKGGVAQLTKALCNEWARYNICINAIAPGYMDTPMNVALVNDPVRNTEILSRIPAGRWGTADDLLGLTIFLSTKASDYINGAVIPCDGGYLVR